MTSGSAAYKEQKKKSVDWTSLKFKTSVLRNTIKKVKRQPIEWEKVCTKPIWVRELYSDYIKNNSIVKRQQLTNG